MFQSYVELSAAHPLLMAFVQFALLGTAGEVLARRLRGGGGFPFSAGKTLCKVLGWGLLGIYIKYMFTAATAAVEAMTSHGYLPAALGSREGLALVGNALLLSVVLNVMFGPSMMILHRLADNAIDKALDGRSAGWEGLDKSLATLLWIWIPLHTVTFCMPRDVRIGIAALLSLVLGLVMGAFARRGPRDASSSAG
jgi:hypothetical protein